MSSLTSKMSKKSITFFVFTKKSSHCDPKSYNIPLHILWDDQNNLIIQFPLFNFSVLQPNAFLRSESVKELFNYKTQRHLIKCSNNDVFLQSYSLETLPVTTPINPPYFELYIRKGRFILTGPKKAPIAPGFHTFCSQCINFGCAVKTEFSHCSKHVQKIPQTLSILDANGVTLPNTQFTVSLSVSRDNVSQVVKVVVPAFTFTVVTDISPNDTFGEYYFRPGGGVHGCNNPLPTQFRPSMDQTRLVEGYHFNIVMEKYGLLRVLSNVNVGGIIDPGTYTIPETTFLYMALEISENIANIPENFIVDPGFANISQFTNAAAQNNAYRDFHANDFFDGLVAYTWPSNAEIVDKTNNQLNVYARTCSVDSRGKVTLNPIVNVSQMVSEGETFDQSIGINRTNKQNLSIVFGIENRVPTRRRLSYTSFSSDGGLSWSFPTLLYATTSPGDAGDLVADRFGNFWIVIQNNVDGVRIYSSSNGGQTYTLASSISIPPMDNNFDFPIIDVGNDGQVNYGVYILYDNILTNQVDTFSTLVFLPVTGLGQYSSTLQSIDFPGLNQQGGGEFTVTPSGTVLIQTDPNSASGGVGYSANTFYRKTLGVSTLTAFDGPKTVLNSNQNIVNVASAPGIYFPNTQRNIIYYCKRNVTYVVFQVQDVDTSQDFYLFLVVSFDEGTTWSKQFPLSTSHHNNRGFSSIQLDHVTGHLAVGWQDSRNSSDSTGVQYFGCIISCKQLDIIVREARVC